MAWGVGRREQDQEAVTVVAHLPVELSEGAQEVADVVRVRIVEEQAIDGPLVGVVGSELDAVDDGLLFEAELLTLAEGGGRDVLGDVLALVQAEIDLLVEGGDELLEL